jgi:hypothetical protein
VLDSVKRIRPKIRFTRPSPQLDALLGPDLSGTPAPAGEPAAAPKPEPGAPEATTPPALALVFLRDPKGDIARAFR